LDRTRIAEVLAFDEINEQEITVCGWIKSKRESKNFAFIMLNDGTSQQDLQVIIDANQPAYALLPRCQTGAAVRIQGVLVASPGKGQKWEMHARDGEVFGEADPERYPLQKKGHSLEFLREISHLRGRTNTFGAVFRVRNCLARGIHDFFQKKHFMWLHTPVITGSDCEGAGELFRVTTLPMDALPRDDKGAVDYAKDFFGKPAYLTVSGQLQGEAGALSLGDVYTFGPTFRAENSNTTRHLAEFWMVEPEMAFAGLEEDMALAEAFLQSCFATVLEQCPEELGFLEKMYKNSSVDLLQNLAQASFARCTYTDAIDILTKSGKSFEYPVSWGKDLQSEHERYLSEEVFKGPVIVYNYPKEIKPFYMRLNDDGKTVAAMDVLMPRIGEIIGGSQREDRLDLLTANMAASGIEAEHLAWYLDLRRYGGAPHAGFGLGFERLVQYVTGMANIRDVIPFARAPQTIEF